MDLNWRQKTVLAGVLRDQRTIAAQDYHGGDNLPYMVKGNYRLRIRRAKEGYVPVNISGWLGVPLTNSETVMFCREHERLERMGLLERCNLAGGTRTTHLRLTDEGKRIAEGFLAKEAEEAPIDTSDLDLMPIDWSELAVAETDATTAP